MGWGNPVYRHISTGKDRIGDQGAGLRMRCRAFRTNGRGSRRLVAGIDAAEQLIDIAAERTPDGDFRTGDLEALPWPDDSLMW